MLFTSFPNLQMKQQCINIKYKKNMRVLFSISQNLSMDSSYIHYTDNLIYLMHLPTLTAPLKRASNNLFTRRAFTHAQTILINHIIKEPYSLHNIHMNILCTIRYSGGDILTRKIDCRRKTRPVHLSKGIEQAQRLVHNKYIDVIERHLIGPP